MMKRRFNPLPVLLAALVAATLLLSRFTVVLHAAAPTLISYNDATAAWTTTTDPKSTASISWQTNDVLVVIAGTESNSFTPAVPTNTGSGLSWVSQQFASATSGTICGGRVSTAVASANSSGTVSVSAATSGHWGFGVWVFRNSTGVGVSAEQHTSSKSLALSPAANAAVVWSGFDFNADGALSGLPTPTTTRQSFDDGTSWSVGVFDKVDTSATSFQLTGGGTTGPFTLLALEVKNDGASGCTPTMLLLGVGRCGD